MYTIKATIYAAYSSAVHEAKQRTLGSAFVSTISATKHSTNKSTNTPALISAV